jgi:hypothetical protein
MKLIFYTHIYTVAQIYKIKKIYIYHYVFTAALTVIFLVNQMTLSIASTPGEVLPVVDIYLCINFWLCYLELP